MWNSGSIEIVLSLPRCDFIATYLQEQSSRFRIHRMETIEPEIISRENWAKADVLVTEGFLPAPDLAPNLKWVQFFNHYDLDAVNEYKKVSPKTVFTSAEGVAIFEQSQNCLYQLLASVDEYRYLYNATIGIIGYGSLGREMARILRSFNCTILAATFNAMNPIATTYQPENTGDPSGDCFDRLYPIQALSTMLQGCDFVINTMNLDNRSKNFLNSELLINRKSTAPYINASPSLLTNPNSDQPAIEKGDNSERPVINTNKSEIRSNQYYLNFLDLLQQNFKSFIEKHPMLNIIQ
jgi:phosphoglycerate dehydrogenase-like enzyme